MKKKKHILFHTGYFLYLQILPGYETLTALSLQNKIKKLDIDRLIGEIYFLHLTELKHLNNRCAPKKH